MFGLKLSPKIVRDEFFLVFFSILSTIFITLFLFDSCTALIIDKLVSNFFAVEINAFTSLGKQEPP